ncbi:MAG: hypothetical protein AAGD01_11690 [Acidobacteriota bacterium]
MSRIRRIWRAATTAALGLSAALILSGSVACGGSAPAPTPEVRPAPKLEIPSAERPFLISPLEGYPLVLDPQRTQEIREAWQKLLGGEPEVAESTAAELLNGDPGLHPARVLFAQRELVAKRYGAAAEALRPVVDELPEYSAALLALGRAEEELGRVVEAYAAYRQLPDRPIAQERRSILEDRALEIVARRAQDAATRGRGDDAAAELEILRQWAPDLPVTWLTAYGIAETLEDEVALLEATRALASYDRQQQAAGELGLEEDWDLRQGQLEASYGNPGTALEILRPRAAAAPDDLALAESLAVAKLRWRVSTLPQEIQVVTQTAELTRGDSAVLLYWLWPGVRRGTIDSGRIATDILDHPQREPIAKVVNLQLMDVDEGLHRFEPDRTARRIDVLKALLLSLQRQQPGPACLASAPLSRRPSWGALCGAATRCDLVPSESDCLPGAGLSGREALELVHRAMKQLGGA